MNRTIKILISALSFQVGTYIESARAVEGAAGFYLLGAKTSMAGFIPPPGTYISDLNYYYSGKADVELEFAGLTLSGGIDADAYYNMPTGVWVAPEQVLGGHAAFTVMAPIGWKKVEAGAIVSGPLGGSVSGQIRDDETAFGDPVIGAAIGWHDGNWHWNVGTLLNIPIGFWELGNIANIGFNRWAFDVTGAVTYLDMRSGIELSGAVGLTFNGENSDTDYKSGTEFHFEGAAVQNFSKSFGVGINVYYYEQVTGDSGGGAHLGSFEGRVAALGPVVNWNFEIGKIPVNTSFKYFHEFDVKNRLEGDSGFFTLTMPLSVEGH